MRSALPRFVAATLGWLPLTFAIWYFAAPLLLWPVELLSSAIAAVSWPDLVQSVARSGRDFTFATTLRPGLAIGGGHVTVDANPLLYSFGLPMFAALTLAARQPAWLRRLAIGYAAIIPFATFGVLADFLKNVAITAGPMVASQTGFSAAQRELIAFAYQFGSLILPTVVPAVLWVLLHRDFLERLRTGHSPAGV